MKTMMALLIRVQQLRECCLRAARNQQLTDGERNSARFFKELVRGCLPAPVLRHYDRLKRTEPELLENPEVFAMAVLVDTYRSLSPAGRKRLLAHFANASPQVPRRNGKPRSQSQRRLKRRHPVSEPPLGLDAKSRPARKLNGTARRAQARPVLQ